MPLRSRPIGPAALLALALFSAALMGGAGPLNPPPGPVAPSYKTLDQVEPRIPISAATTPGDANSLFRISQPGSYYLTGNITGVSGKHGIEIASGGVTLDLMGFDLAGVPGMGAFDGVSVSVTDISNIAVVNGSVRGWGADGVDLGLSFTEGARAADLRVSGNAGVGISAGRGGVVTGCATSTNGSFGIRAGVACTITRCSSIRNANHGFSTLGEASFAGCTAWLNTGDGFDSALSTFSNCLAADNGGVGIDAGTGSTLTGCSAASNTGNGINTASGATVSACTALANDGIGFNVGIGSAVIGCVARENTLGGIACAAMCTIRGNTCSDTGSIASNGANIRVTSTLCRIEGNSCVGADVGIQVDNVNNVIVRNTCSSNTVNWIIVAGNDLAPIVVAAENAAAVNGNTYAGSLGSTDPNANFTH